MTEEKRGRMKKERAKLKKEMLEMAEGRIEELLDWQEKNGRPTLSQIENQVLKQSQSRSSTTKNRSNQRGVCAVQSVARKWPIKIG